MRIQIKSCVLNLLLQNTALTHNYCLGYIYAFILWQTGGYLLERQSNTIVLLLLLIIN